MLFERSEIMAVKLRLTRGGSKKKPTYRIVAIDSHTKRDGEYIELVGTYNPRTNPKTVTVKVSSQDIEVGAVSGRIEKSANIESITVTGKNEWYVTRCACCGVKLKTNLRNGDIFPQHKFCSNCGHKIVLPADDE